MARVAFIGIAVLAAPVPATTATVVDEVSHIIVDENCVVTSFYDVPLNLKLSELDDLHIDHTRGFVSDEGTYYPAATLLVGKNVLLQAEFDSEDEHKLYQLSTISPGAIGPRGVAIGATLKEVRRKWPEGNFYWARAHGPYVAFKNGTNVYFEFDPRDMPPNAFNDPPVPVQTAGGEWIAPRVDKVEPDPEKLKVTAIRITSGNRDYTCPNSDRKTK